MSNELNRSYIETLCAEAASVKGIAAALTTPVKIEALAGCSKALLAETDAILAANAKDIDRGIQKGMSEGLLDRLRLTKERIAAMAQGLTDVSALPDPIGEVLDRDTRPNGLQITKVRVPIGVIGTIYESRPNVTADAFALCFMSGNVVILKGGSDAIDSNRAIVRVLQDALASQGLPRNLISFIDSTDRADTAEFMQQYRTVDVLIPRGSAALIQSVVQSSRIPVLETGAGNCHLYVDKSADPQMAVQILINGKTQRLGVCNALESLVVHRDCDPAFWDRAAAAMREHRVTFYADEEARAHLPEAEPATEADFAAEYLDRKISVKTVGSVEEAVEHINRYHTKHSDAIVTRDEGAAQYFLAKVDSACVYVNASTRFTDGFEFGFGAEIGISTQMLHARGPMGLRELTSYKYQIRGEGQTRP